MTFTLARCRQSYITCALLILNAVIFLVLLNLAIFLGIAVRDYLNRDPEVLARNVASQPGRLFRADGSPIDNGKRSAYELKWIDLAAYEHLDERAVGQVLDDFYELEKLGFIYQPWVQFAEPPFSGKQVHVDIDPRGFPIRRTVQPANSKALPVIEIFVLGGSTAFGYFVSDEHTFPSYLAKILNDRAEQQGGHVYFRVTNYAHAYFHPGQEAVLIGDLLKSGHRPSLVVFMDGVNVNAYDVPFFTARLSQNLRNLQFEAPLSERLDWLPMVKLARSLSRRWLEKPAAAAPQETLDHVVNRTVNLFNQNQQIAAAICQLYSSRALFFLQPNAKDNYGKHLYRRALTEEFLAEAEVTKHVYRRLRAEKKRIDLAHLFELWGADRKAIVDDVHYSPGFNAFIARHVADAIAIETFKPQKLAIEEAAATGLPRPLALHQ